MKVSTVGFVSDGGRRLRLGVGMMAVVLAGTVVVLQAHAQPPHGGEAGMMMFEGRGGPMFHHIDRMLDGLAVTADQRARIRQIAAAAEADLRTQREAGRGLRDRGLKIFAAPTVDAGAAESLRQETMAQEDQASRRKLDAMLEVSKVLTPEQRAKIGARALERQAVMQERRERMTREHHPHPMAPAPQKP